MTNLQAIFPKGSVILKQVTLLHLPKMKYVLIFLKDSVKKISAL